MTSKIDDHTITLLSKDVYKRQEYAERAAKTDAILNRIRVEG